MLASGSLLRFGRFQRARREPLITLGSAPLEAQDFRGVVLGQLGEPRLLPAIETDVSGEHLTRRLSTLTQKGLCGHSPQSGTTILFESSGGQVDKLAHLPELRFALGELRSTRLQ